MLRCLNHLTYLKSTASFGFNWQLTFQYMVNEGCLGGSGAKKNENRKEGKHGIKNSAVVNQVGKRLNYVFGAEIVWISKG